MNNQYITRTTRISIMPKGEPIFGEKCTHISIEDESAGEFIRITQSGDQLGSVTIDSEDWPSIKAGIEKMIEEIQHNEKHG